MTDRVVLRRAMHIACMAGVLLTAKNALAGWPDVEFHAATEMRTGVGKATERFMIADPDARTSDAARDNTDLISKGGVVPAPTPGFRVTSIVLMKRPPGPQPLPAMLAGLDVSPVDGLSEWSRIDAGSVGAAVALADQLDQEPGVVSAFVDVQRPIALRGPTDPGFPLQWHLANAVSPGVDVGAQDAWDRGFTGAGVLVGVIEGGWQTDHPDIAPNYNALASMPGGSITNHATSVAGLIGAARDNGLGGVGVAYGSRVSKLVNGSALENTNAFLWLNGLHHIKNNSWGPIDNGTLGQITALERDALAASVLGRGGLGTVFVWAGGNGADSKDRTDYDPYASSRFAICVGAIDDDDDKSYYSEPGSSLMVVAHSSGGPGPGDEQIYTTKGGSAYTMTFGGTSTSAPIVAGVVAMMLQSNPFLSWRDVQHVLVNSARKCDPLSPTWVVNNAGFDVSYSYGFGAVRALDAAMLAKVWHPIPPEHIVTSGTRVITTAIPDGNASGLTRTLTIPDDVVVEAIELKLNVTTTYVGDLNVMLRSPTGTESILAATRTDSTDNFADTILTSRRNWGERAAGTWTVTISDPVLGDPAVWQTARLTAYGYCPSDVNRDGVTDVLDLLDFIDSFSSCAGVRAPCFGIGPAAADYNRDEIVDVLDMLDMLEDFGHGC